MGFRISYVIAPAIPRELVKPLGFKLGIETDALPYGEWWVGTLKSNNKTVLWSETEEFVDDVSAQLAALSHDGEVYACRVNETVMATQAVCYSGGHEKWRISWQGEDGPIAENLVASGALPQGFAALLQKQTEAQASDDQTDHFFEVPLAMVADAAGFRHDFDMTNKAFSRFFRISETADGTPAAPPKKGFLARLLGR